MPWPNLANVHDAPEVDCNCGCGVNSYTGHSTCAPRHVPACRCNSLLKFTQVQRISHDKLMNDSSQTVPRSFKGQTPTLLAVPSIFIALRCSRYLHCGPCCVGVARAGATLCGLTPTISVHLLCKQGVVCFICNKQGICGRLVAHFSDTLERSLGTRDD